MPHTTSHAPGSFCWLELATSDAPAARDFYTRLLDWTVVEEPMGELGTYYRFQKDGYDAAAMYHETRMPPSWVSYIAVRSADESAAKVKSLGGEVHKDPFDVFDLGRMAIIGDPQGATFAIWEARQSAGLAIRDEPGALCWNELQARDVAAAKTFYPTLFGWRMKESPDYTEWHLGADAVGGMLPSQAPPEVPSFWMPYFAVEDCDAAAAKAESIGATVYAPPMDIEKVGRFSVLGDPQGATFAVIKLTM